MGTLLTGLTVLIIKRSTEPLNDLLYDSEFNNIELVISNQLDMYSVLKIHEMEPMSMFCMKELNQMKVYIQWDHIWHDHQEEYLPNFWHQDPWQL